MDKTSSGILSKQRTSKALEFPKHYQFGSTRKIPKYSDTQNIAVIILKLEQCDYYSCRSPKDANRMANSVDPDQTAPAPLGAV